MKTSPSRAALAALLLLVLAAGSARASKPVYFELDDRADIEKGNADGVSIAANGALALAPALATVFDTKQTYVWSSVSDAKGTVYLGTGHEGRVFAVDAAGKGREVLDTPELDVTALALDPASGALFAATSPDGKIYRIAPDGTSAVYFDPEDKYIWSLAFRDGALYAGTGEKGVIYRVTAAGQGKAWVDTDEVHVISLAFTPRGDLVAGTDPGALVLRISPDGKPFTLFDSPLQEMHAVRVGPDGAIYGLAIATSAATTATEQTSISTADSTTTTASSPDIATLGTTDVKSRRDTSDAKSALYRIAPDGASDVLWSSKTVVGYSAFVDTNRVLIGTGDRGRVLSVDPTTRDVTVLVQSYEDQTSTLLSAGSALYATSNTLGKLFRVGPGTVAKGTYESPVHDAKAVSQWGRVAIRAGAGASVETRSGNTDTPDSTWSEWAPARAQGADAVVASPPARYLQWRLTLSAPSGRAQSVAVSYLPRNIAPEITLLAVLPAGIGLQETPTQPIDPGILSSGFDPSIFGLSTNLPARRVYQKGARSLLWQAKDPDDDKLSYSLYYHSLSDSAWHPLASALTTAYYTIDSDALPDGVYLFRVVADDSPSNPAPLAHEDEKTTEPVEVDNTPPAVSADATPVVRGDTVEVTFVARDSTSRVTKAAYSVDGGAWFAVYPTDGIADSTVESFALRIPQVAPGEHVLAFRAVDSSLNVGSAKVTVTVK